MNHRLGTSEAVYVGVCRIVGTPTQVSIRREVANIAEIIMTPLEERMEVRRLLNGSSKEGFGHVASDMDCMIWQTDDHVICELSQAENYNTERYQQSYIQNVGGLTLDEKMSTAIARDIRLGLILIKELEVEIGTTTRTFIAIPPYVMTLMFLVFCYHDNPLEVASIDLSSSIQKFFCLNRDKLRQEVEDKGYAVVPDLLTPEECDSLMSQYKDWVNKFDEGHIPLQNRASVIQSYRVGHFKPSWEVRLKSKAVFEAIWGTEKLLSSTDGIAISKPPENADQCRETHKEWLHLDQGAQREGLHAYQGAVYLEEQTKDDYCFRVLSKSHLYHSELFKTFPNGAARTARFEFYKLSKKQKEFYYKKGCTLECVPVPKGGIVIWDSRTVHDNAPPTLKRPNPDRWRFVIFVSMTPAQWASEKERDFRKDAYRRMLLTTHWSSQGLKTFKDKGNRKRKFADVSIDSLPDVAKTKEARLLVGDERYNFADEHPNGPKAPKWRRGYDRESALNKSK
ncbi:uncharacterized protein LOC133203993 [Saccostrea echinata]|uniref:uncharacterized protein LOC133203993 n=1 Tax=Saccostrea echinata TaxID=191078 RepID=UPI002A7EECE5|nr:uncharacterized protein LOC133203993 [Saccostrea echinata]